MKKILEILKKCCEKIHQNDKSKSKDEVKKILASTLKISVDTIELSDNVISIKGNSTSELYIDDIEIDAVFSLGNLEDKEDIHTIFVKYDFEFGYCIFKNINLSTGLECQNLSFSDCHFNNEVNLSLSEFKSLSFSDCHFNNEVNLSLSEFKSLSFSDCHFNNEVNFSSAKSKERTSFKDCKFKDEVDFTKAEFENNDFGNIFCSITFEKKVDFTQFKFNQDINDLTFRDEVIFDNTEFLKEIILSGDNFILEDVNFEECIFDKVDIEDDFLQEKNISFKSCQFKKIIAFRKKNIKNITFGTCTFEQGVYFVSCVFSNANFYNCNFNNAACFYGSTFNMAPNFSQSVFKDSPNLVNIKAKFDFQNLNTTIENIYKPKDEAANDFRDSFRTFKNALIKDNNLLDASKFHKYELYCKELELENKKDKTLKDKIDKWQLVFYRKLCDHHTDLLKAFHNLLIVIMLFGMFSFALDKFKQPSHIENDIKYNIVKVDSNENYIFKEHNKTTYNLLSLNIEQESDKFIKNDFVYMIVFLILVLLLLSFNIFTSIYIFGSILYLIFSFLDLLALYTHIAVIVFFVLFALKFILLDDRQRYKRGIVVAISYTVCIFTLLVKPSLLLPALGNFLDKDSNATYPLLLSLSVVYFMLVVLILFSLQKTARKNSIVPS
ncbi:TPA: pentapeptide repeat-containing protein [Campylobacter coli]|nr:pentapeptide repeat-containing protein [Campylobacter coli]